MHLFDAVILIITVQKGVNNCFHSLAGWIRSTNLVFDNVIITSFYIIMVLQHGGWARGQQPLTVKNQLVTKCFTGRQNLAASCEHGNEPSVSVKGGEFLY
jgi:hypothetical protein